MSAYLIGNGQMIELRGETGITPPEPKARFKAGETVKVRRLKHLLHLPEIGAVAAVVPIGYSPDWAWADLHKKPRPPMAQVGRRIVQYIVAFEGDTRPHLLSEKALKPSGLPPADIQIT